MPFFVPGPLQPEHDTLRWLVKTRYLMVLFLGVCGWLEYRHGYFPKPDGVAWYFGVLASLLFYNVAAHGILGSAQARDFPEGALTGFQLGVDIAALGALLVQCGGFENPLFPLLYLNALLCGLLLTGWTAALLAGILLATLLAVQFSVASASGLPLRAFFYGYAEILLPHYLILAAAWFIARSLGRRMHESGQAARRAQSSLAQRDRLTSLGALVAGFSHEFASPLNAAKVHFKLAVDGSKRPKAALLEVGRALERMEDVLRSMHAAHQESDAPTTDSGELGTLTLDVGRAWERHRNATLRCPGESGPTPRIPKLGFSQTLVALLDNAWEAGGGAPVTLGLRRAEAETVLSVIDEGPGFAQDALKRLGEPFNTTKNRGSGLGLYSARLFMLSVGGDLRVVPRAAGCCVELRFPSAGV